MSAKMIMEKVWLNKYLFDEAERRYYENLAKNGTSVDDGKDKLVTNTTSTPTNINTVVTSTSVMMNGESLVAKISDSIARCRQEILLALQGFLEPVDEKEILNQVESIDKENEDLKKEVSDLQAIISKLEKRVASLEIDEGNECTVNTSITKAPAAPAKVEKKAAPADNDDDDDIDLFASDDEADAAAEALREKRLAEYAEKKSQKKQVIAKSSVVLDVKPWDDETDMVKLEECVRSIQKDGLVWGVSKLVPVAYNVKKLQIVCVVEDDKVGIEELSEEITAFEDYVQSVDVAAFNKI